MSYENRDLEKFSISITEIFDLDLVSKIKFDFLTKLSSNFIFLFRLYLDKIIHSADCDVTTLARGTTGFTGADIENMVNQAALKAATERAMRVTMKHLDEARDRILMGPARLKGLHADEEANRNTGKFMIVFKFYFLKSLS